MTYVNEKIRNLYRVKVHDQREGFLRLDMNENPEGLPDWFFSSVIKKITPEYIATYPVKDNLVAKIAKINKLEFNNISVTAGSDEAMRLIFQCFGEPGKKVLTVTPTFEMYGVYANMFGMEHCAIEYDSDFLVETRKILESITTDVGIIVLLNPNSPIGTIYEENDVREILNRAKSVGALVLIDEAYYYFCEHTFLPLIKEYNNLLIIRTFSKLFSMAGLRVGYVVGNEALIGYVEKAESTFNVNNIALLFAEEAIDNKELIAFLIQEEKEGREWLIQRLKEYQYKYIAMEGNYILIYPNKSSGDIVNGLKQKNVWIRDYKKGVLNGWIRVSTGSVDCMQRFWEVFLEYEAIK